MIIVNSVQVYWRSRCGALEEYVREMHLDWAEKFLCYRQDDEFLIIVGAHSNHPMLASDLSVDGQLVAAGNIRQGEIVTWRSIGFGVTTPEEMKDTLRVIIAGQ